MSILPSGSLSRTLLGLGLAASLGLASVGCESAPADGTAGKKSSTGSGSGGAPATPAKPGESSTGGLSAEEAKEVLAEGKGVKITAGEFMDRINKQSPYVRARYTSVERKKEFLNNLIRFEVLAQEAAKRGLDKDADVQRSMKQVMIQKLMRAEHEGRVKMEDIKDEEVKEYYDKHQEEFNKPEQVRFSQIVVADQAAADKLLAEAKEKPTDFRHFRELVQKNSTDTVSKARGGDVMFVSANDTTMPKPVVEAAFALKDPNTFGPVVKSDKGFHIIKLTARKPPLSQKLEDVKKTIQARLFREKRTKALEGFTKDLQDKAEVKTYAEKLEKLKIDTTSGAMRPPGMPGMGGPGGPGGAHGGLKVLGGPGGRPNLPGLPGAGGGAGGPGGGGGGAPGGHNDPH